MATGGTGDVLTGMLAGLTAQFGSGFLARALAFGVYLHGLAGDHRLRMYWRSPADGLRPDSLLFRAPTTFLRRVRPWLASEFITHSSEETIARGREIGAALKPPVLILLSGDLGAGKTTLTKGIAGGMGAAREDDVTSPTFTLVHRYEGRCARLSRGSLPHRAICVISNSGP